MTKKLYKWKTHSNEDRHINSFNPDTCTWNIPDRALVWLHTYGITSDDIKLHSFWYDNLGCYLVMPTFNGSELVHICKRYFGANLEHPKYITQGFKTGFFKVFPNPSNNILVLVEDYLSAIRVSHSFSSIPLHGTFAPRELILKLLPQRPILRFWLDRDAADKAITQTNKVLQFLPDCGTIITEKDPKCYTNEEINDIVSLTLKGIS
jgi:hypothetical protein